MIIPFRGLKEGETQKVSFEYDPKALELEFYDFIYSNSVSMKGTIERGIDTVTFRGELEGEVQQTCGRCLKVDRNSLKKRFELFYETKDKESIDATEDVREMLIMEHPMVYTCREGQKTPCKVPTNGKDWVQFSGPEKSAQKPFSSLKKILDRSKKEKKHGTS